jgi:quinoprotein glucose dehydrogenase
LLPTTLRLPRLICWLTIAALSIAASDEPAPLDASGPTAGWPSYGGDPGGSRYSPLTQITPENVTDLEVAWTYRTGDYPGGRVDVDKTAFQATPILEGDTLYFCSPLSRAFAIDARTGEERWIFDAAPSLEGWTNTCRGVALWRGAKGEAGPCAGRIFMGTTDGRLVAVDADTGLACEAFGDAAALDLRDGLGDVGPGEMYMTSPPTVIGDVVVTGSLVADNRRVDPPGGVVRAFDVRSGELRWAFDPVPPGTPPLPDGDDGEPRFHRGTPNAWSILSVDPERNLVFVPFGNPSPDYFGGHRRGFDYYGSSVVALDGGSGEPVWRFQTVHHDLWDYDVASQPVLIDVWKDGRAIPAVAQATKMGHLFLLDRGSGRPIHPVEERPVPQTDVPGERTAPTQPFPTFPPPLHPHRLSPEDAFGFLPYDRGACRELIASLRNEGIFTPPSLGGSVEYPGIAGGANWGSLAFDPSRRLIVLTQNHIGEAKTLIRREDMPPGPLPKRVSLQEGTPYLVRSDVLVSPFGVPCVPPPWGSLMAVSLDTGEKVWGRPFGATRDVIPFFPIGFDLGMPSMGGPIVTASGLVFIGASMDDYLRAYDVETGEELWRARLPAGGQATPMTYRIGTDSRQYVVIAAGGHSKLGTNLGDSLMAFALPENTRAGRK